MTVETIFALSSGNLPSGVAVIRISGPGSAVVLEQMCGRIGAPRVATLTEITDPQSGDMLDRGLVLWFPPPHSFTGEACIELHLHGSMAVVADVLAALGKLPGLRPAEPGEFTRRAYEAGKMDLMAAEGLADLIAAQTSLQRRQALRQAQGTLGTHLENWRGQLLKARALIEADLDFSDEDDVPGSVANQVWTQVGGLAAEIAEKLETSKAGERIRSGVVVVILGAPNAGKSSLLNALAKREVAIVTSEAGTTRDLLEISLDLDGAPVTVVDTAGLRDTESVVEAEGIKRARARAREADLVLWLQDGSDDAAAACDLSLRDLELQALENSHEIWTILTKSDKRSKTAGIVPRVRAQSISANREITNQGRRHDISVVTEGGLDALLRDLTEAAHRLCGSHEQAIVTRARHRIGLERVLGFLNEGLADECAPIELRSEYLRSAGDELGRITGKIDVEDLLGVIFSEFCIGK